MTKTLSAVSRTNCRDMKRDQSGIPVTKQHEDADISILEVNFSFQLCLAVSAAKHLEPVMVFWVCEVLPHTHLQALWRCSLLPVVSAEV